VISGDQRAQAAPVPRRRSRPPAWVAEPQAGRRLFIAVPVPDEVSRLVEALVGRIRAEEGEGDASAQAAAGRRPNRVRWVSLDDLHLTIRFLGPTPEERLPALREAVTQAAARLAPFAITIADAGAFPSLARPRALWLGVTDLTGGMALLADVVGNELEAAGWPRDDRPYTPHLTLARSDGVRTGPRVARRLVAAAAGLSATFGVDRLVLYESHTGRGPARYEPLHVVRLGG